MRLYLSSFKLGDQPDQLVALAEAGRCAAIVMNALDNFPEQRKIWLERQSEELRALGFVTSELDLRYYFGNSDKLDMRMKFIDLVWVNGGNSFILRRAMKQSGFDVIIRQALERNEIVYGGFSAGAVICAPILHGLELIDQPEEVPSGYDPEVVWDGLGLIPFSIAVHFRSDHPEALLVEDEIAFFKAEEIPFRVLRDGEVLVIDGDRQEIVGSAPATDDDGVRNLN